MLVSEQASKAVVLADHTPGASTYPGTRTRGGWIPILLKPKDGRPIISDWICPTCKCLTGNYRCCSHCGLEVLARPRIKAPLQKGARIYQYRQWADKLFEVDDETTKPRSKKEMPIRSKLSSSQRRSG